MNGYVEPVAIRTACGKRGFATSGEADAAAARTETNRDEPGNGPSAYRCETVCGLWHVGHPVPSWLATVITVDEWRHGAGRAMRQADNDITAAVGLPATWSRVGQAWRVTVDHPTRGQVSSKPSADPGLAAESLLGRLRRLPET